MVRDIPHSFIPQWPEKFPDVLDQGPGFFQGRKMPAGRHGGPALQIEHAFGPFPGGAIDLPGKGNSGCGHADMLTGSQSIWVVTHLVVQPERAVDRLRYPIQHDICQQFVLADSTFNIPLTIGPGVKFFRYPCGQTDRRVVQRKRQRLGFGALDPLVTGLFPLKSIHLFEKILLRRAEIGAVAGVGGKGHHVQMDTCYL